MTVIQWITLAIAWLGMNLVLLVKLQQGICIVGSGLCQLFGWTKASKWFGTFAAVDLGRIVRNLPAVWAFALRIVRVFLPKPTLLGLHFTAWALTGAGLGIGIGAGIATSSCAPKNTIGATCPANAICDRVDFGAGAITVCLSPSDLAQVQAAAARSRAATKTTPDGGAQ